MRRIAQILLLVSMCLVCSLSWAQTTDTYIFRTLLSPANEVPPIAGLNASGTGIVWLHVVRDGSGNIVRGAVDFRTDYRGFPANTEFTGMHIHPAPAGVNGPVAIDSGIGGTNTVTDPVGTGTLLRSASIISSNTNAFNAFVGVLSQPENFYLNVHTRVNPGGAIRGQLSRADVLVVRGAMSPANEVPAITGLDASGSASVTIYATRDDNGAITSGTVNFATRYSFPGEVTLTGLHIHHQAGGAPAGVNAGVTVSSGLTSTPDSDGAGSFNFWVEVTSAAGLETLETLFRDPSQTYINLHTTVNPGGAIRSQLQRTETIVLRGLMSPSNEVPPVTGLAASAPAKVTLYVVRDASGQIASGTALFDVSFELPAVLDFTGLHIHPGAAGTNGPVAISSGLATSSSRDVTGNVFLAADVAAGDTNALAALRGLPANPANYYINLHTTANPGGAIRAQLGLGGEPELRVTLDPGYYIVETTLPDGEPGGVWAMIVLSNGALSGGFNLGGGFGGGGGIPGFGAFYLAQSQTVRLNLASQTLPGQPDTRATLGLLNQQRQPVSGNLSAGVNLSPGFYIAEVRSQGGAGTFQLGIGTDVLTVGAIAGGWASPGLTGFGAFNLGSRQTVEIRTFGKAFYTPIGAGNLTLALKRADGTVVTRAQ